MRDARQRAACRVRKRRSRSATRMLTLAFLVGAALSIWPLASEAVAASRAHGAISSMTSYADETHDVERLSLLSQAQTYNLHLGGTGARMDNEGMAGGNAGEHDILSPGADTLAIQAAPYERQLGAEQEPICWLEIPAIALSQPVFRGSDDDTLAMGAGHLEWSSLPVGGVASHCVIAAHSGMRDARMFDDLDKLREGDCFVVHTLGDAYCYAIYQIETVRPEEARERCALVAGEDLCTLMTCTPYGINTHRLLVHGRRTPFVAPRTSAARQVANLAAGRRVRPLILMLLVLLASTGIHICSLHVRRRHP